MTKRARKILLKSFPFTPSTYPGRRPRFSFLFTKKGIYRLKLRDLDRTLVSRVLAPTGERYAILAYGSNACPTQLLDKGLDNVPVLFGRLTGAEAVYANRITSRGYVPATLARKKGSRSSWVTLLTAEQLRTMDASEGRPNVYVLAKLRSVHFSIGKSQITPLYSYVDVRGGIMTTNGGPVSLRSARQRRAKSLLQVARSEEAARWLEFETVPDLTPPVVFSRILSDGAVTE